MNPILLKVWPALSLPDQPFPSLLSSEEKNDLYELAKVV